MVASFSFFSNSTRQLKQKRILEIYLIIYKDSQTHLKLTFLANSDWRSFRYMVK